MGKSFIHQEGPGAVKPTCLEKAAWRGVAVYVDHVEGRVHPVTRELLGKARELADKVSQPVYAVFLGSDIAREAEELLHYGADEIFVADAKELKDFKIETYAVAFEQFVEKVHPAVILFGATSIGRQLAARVAAHFRTGITADCTALSIRENGDLVQTRPAFGGNIMVEIVTPHHCPQMATVRYKIMDTPKRMREVRGKIVPLAVTRDALESHVEVLRVVQKTRERSIETADVLVVAGRGVKRQEDIEMLRALADALGGEIACTRPLVEAGWMDAKHQIGLSGRAVHPKLLLTCGVSGAVQFVAGMRHAECIIAINEDPKAHIFKVANYALIGDLYEIVPRLLSDVCKGKEENA